LNLHPRSHIDISVQVLQSDGSLLQAAINATTLALIDAGVPVNDYVCAVTCALHDNTPLLDINSLEESDLPNVTVGILPRSSKVTLATLETQLSVDRFPEILRLTGEAAKAIHAEMILSVKARTDRLARAMDGIDKPVASKEDVEMAEA
jgi:exosome complex component RRP41